ncbi:MAG: hypothetical protein QME35_01505 [Thermoanaerobacteraceae bacterium]|nr:hypothetical protein [Thermoanaerobacteraceae bacterium]
MNKNNLIHLKICSKNCKFKAQVTYDFDYNIKEVKELEDKYIGYIEFITNITVTSLSGINPPVKMPMINVFKLMQEKKNNEVNKNKQ